MHDDYSPKRNDATMIITRPLSDGIYCLGASDWRNDRFENLFPLPNGLSYNSYLIRDEKIAILDTVDASVRREYIDNLFGLLDGASPDYLVINHMEPDHCACILDLVERFPEMILVGNRKTMIFFEQFYGVSFPDRYRFVKDGDVLDLGRHKLRTLIMPMVHWPEVTATFEERTGTLFSADAFGSFTPVTGNIFLDEIDDHAAYFAEARRYYANIIGMYGPQVAHAIKKLTALPISTIAPLHGLISRTPADVEEFVRHYQQWSTYTPELEGVLICVGSMYGNTERAMQLLAARLADAGVRNIATREISKTDLSYVIGDCFKYSHIVLAAPTYNFDLFPRMAHLLDDFRRLHLSHRRLFLVGNHTWSSHAVKKMTAALEGLRDMTMVTDPVDILSSLSPDTEAALERAARAIADDLAARRASH